MKLFPTILLVALAPIVASSAAVAVAPVAPIVDATTPISYDDLEDLLAEVNDIIARACAIIDNPDATPDQVAEARDIKA